MFRAAKIDDKKLRCRREAVRCFVSLNISLSHSRSLKVIEMVSFESLDTVFYLYSISRFDTIHKCDGQPSTARQQGPHLWLASREEKGLS